MGKLSLTLKQQTICLGLFVGIILAVCGVKYLSTQTSTQVTNQTEQSSEQSDSQPVANQQNSQPVANQQNSQSVANQQHTATLEDKLELIINGYYINSQSKDSYEVTGLGLFGTVYRDSAIITIDGSAESLKSFSEFAKKYTGANVDYSSYSAGTYTLYPSKGAVYENKN